jgi:hypothetical protein
MVGPEETLPPTTPPENREFASFAERRADVVYELYETAGKIRMRADILDIHASLFNVRHIFTFDLINIRDPENVQNVGRCFRMRCDLITQTMDEMLVHLGQEPCRQKLTFIGDVLNMLANQVGRLSLHGISGGDPSAQLSDEQSLERVEWPTAHDENPYKAELQSIWARLQLAHPVCICQQCRRRNHHTVPR